MKMEYDPDIFDAVEFGDLESIKLYLNENINIDHQDLNGMTLLMFASYYGFEEIVEYLLSFKPNMKLKNLRGNTALDLAIKNNHVKTVEILERTKQ